MLSLVGYLPILLASSRLYSFVIFSSDKPIFQVEKVYFWGGMAVERVRFGVNVDSIRHVDGKIKRILSLLPATICANGRVHLCEWSRPFARMVAIKDIYVWT
jgi:hypothetical protein